jgi:ABC-type uncharacterized transport system YnjBCD permease subunit
MTRVFHDFRQPLQTNSEIVFQIRLRLLFFHVFTSSVSSIHLAIQRYIAGLMIGLSNYM